MKILKRIGIVIGALVILFLLFALWYRATYSMEIVNGFEVNDSSSPQSVLIASQGSEFKDAVVKGIVERLETGPVFVKVIDVSDLSSIQESDWNVIVLIHTWEYSKPPKTVEEFAKSLPSKDNVIVLTTSGDGDFKLEGFDAISSASKLSDVDAIVDKLITKIEKTLGK